MWARRNGLPEKCSWFPTPTSHPWALDCVDDAQILALKGRRLGDGDLIRFPAPMRFSDGSEHREFRFRRGGQKTVLTLTGGRGRFKISRLLERRFEIVREPKVAKTFFPAA